MRSPARLSSSPNIRQPIGAQETVGTVRNKEIVDLRTQNLYNKEYSNFEENMISDTRFNHENVGTSNTINDDKTQEYKRVQPSGSLRRLGERYMDYIDNMIDENKTTEQNGSMIKSKNHPTKVKMRFFNDSESGSY